MCKMAKHKYDIKNSRIEQFGLTDHLRKGVLIGQVVGEIIVNNVRVLCELEKNWIDRLQI